MADLNKTVDIQFQSNADQVKDSVNDLLGTLDKGSAEYEELESAIRGVTNAETDLKNATSGLNDTLDKTSGGVSAMENKIRQATTAYQKKVAELDKINDRYKSVSGSSDNLNKSTTMLTSSVSSNGGAMGLLSELTGGLAMTFKDAGEATELFGGKLSGLKGALIASGIGLAVVIIGELIANWEKWSGVIDGSTEQLKELTSQMDELNLSRDRYLQQTNTEIQLLELNGVSSRRILQEKYKQNYDLIKQQEEALALAEKQYRIEFNRDRDGEKAVEALNKRNEAQGKLNELKNNSLILEGQFNKLERDAEKERQEKLKKQQEEAQKEIDRRKKELEDKIKAERDSAQKLADQAKEANLKNSQTELEQLESKYKQERALLEKFKIDTNDLELKFFNDKNAILLKQQEEEYKIIEADKAKKLELDKKDAEEKVKIEQFVAQAKEQIQQKTLDVASQGIELLTSLAGKNKALQKGLLLVESAVGIAKIVTSTQAANAAVTAKYAPIPGGPALAAAEITLNKVSAGIGIAANLAATSKAMSALGGGGSGGGGASAGASVPASATPNVSFVTSSENQVASNINRQNAEAPPVKAYVVTSEVTTGQSLDRNLIDSSTIG